MSAGHDMRDPRWFPVDVDVRTRTFSFLPLGDELVARSNFLDNRLEAPLSAGQTVPLQSVPAGMPIGRMGWLFHTSFCGSTLAARALHLPPHATCLREPLVLRRLADARFAGASIEDLAAPAVRLLSRPWHTDGMVVVKPTHAALNLVPMLLSAAPASRGIVLTSSLEDFLISNLKKTPETQARIPELARRALAAGTFASRLEESAFAPPDLLCAAALQWAAQREVIADFPADRVSIMGMDSLLADFLGTMRRCAAWLQLELPPEEFEAHCRQIAARNAKAVDVAYGVATRTAEANIVATHFSRELDRARRWADRWLLPFMREEARLVASATSDL